MKLKVDGPLDEISYVGIRMKYIRALKEEQTRVHTAGAVLENNAADVKTSTADAEKNIAAGDSIYIGTGYESYGEDVYEEENVFRCRVVEIIENPFSYTIMLERKDAPGPIPIGWEMVKEVWENMKAEEVAICMPTNSILLLKS